MKEHGQMLNMTGFERPMMKTLCLAFFLIFVFYRSILSASTVMHRIPNHKIPNHKKIPNSKQKTLRFFTIG